MTAFRMLRPLSAVALAAVCVAAVPATAHPAPRPAPVQSDTSLLARADAGRTQGSPSATVWLVEASDFQCPFCKQWHDAAYDALIREYVKTGKVRYAFLNFPLNSIHPHALQAAEAAMCASAQGRFWQMHESLFRTQAKWEAQKDPAAYFDSLAVNAGVQPQEWRHCVTVHATLPLIQADQLRLRNSGVSATPTFFVANQKLEGVQPLDTLRKLLNAALAKSGAP